MFFLEYKGSNFTPTKTARNVMFMYILVYTILDRRRGKQEVNLPNGFVCGFVGYVLKICWICYVCTYSMYTRIRTNDLHNYALLRNIALIIGGLTMVCLTQNCRTWNDMSVEILSWFWSFIDLFLTIVSRELYKLCNCTLIKKHVFRYKTGRVFRLRCS
jgi:hypothetical protein